MTAMVGIPEILAVLLVLLLLAGAAVGVVALALWLMRSRNESPRPAMSSAGSALPEREGPAPGAVCARCGSPLPACAPQGLCPRCVLGAGLASETEAAPAHGPHGTQGMARPLEAEVARRFPQLEILERLGQGGMGVVYKARQPRLNRLVALKILSPEKGADPKFAERFEREAQALARLSHPNIVAVHDFGEADGMYYLLMEYVDGSTLRQLMQTERLTPEAALAIVPSICAALEFAHEQGVVHRDIKPENVLLDASGQVKIADFGIAKLMDTGEPRPGLTEERSVIGTPHYMAPEQVEQPRLVDHRADIYSLGVVLYEMLTGELPIGKFQPPSKKVQVDVRLDDVVLHALEKEPDRRYQHVSQVKTDVESIRDFRDPHLRFEGVGRCRIPGTALALVELQNGQWRIQWNHTFLAGMLLIVAGIAMVRLAAEVMAPVGVHLGVMMAGFGVAFAVGLFLGVVIRLALRKPATEAELLASRAAATRQSDIQRGSANRARQTASGMGGTMATAWTFALGSAWILLAIILLLGRSVARTQPLMYTFFGIGGWLYPFGYNGLIGLTALIGMVCLGLGWMRRGGRCAALTPRIWMGLSAASPWLLAIVALVLGRKSVRSEPVLYAFFGLGGWLDPSTYDMIIAACVLLALASFSVIGFRQTKIAE